MPACFAPVLGQPRRCVMRSRVQERRARGRSPLPPKARSCERLPTARPGFRLLLAGYAGQRSTGRSESMTPLLLRRPPPPPAYSQPLACSRRWHVHPHASTGALPALLSMPPVCPSWPQSPSPHRVLLPGILPLPMPAAPVLGHPRGSPRLLASRTP